MFCFPESHSPSTSMKIFLKHQSSFLDMKFLILFLTYLMFSSDGRPDIPGLVSPVFQRHRVEQTFCTVSLNSHLSYTLIHSFIPLTASGDVLSMCCALPCVLRDFISLGLYRCLQYVLYTSRCAERTRHNPSTQGLSILAANEQMSKQLSHARI